MNLLQTIFYVLELHKDAPNLYIEIDSYKNENHAKVVIEGAHTNITKIVKNESFIWKRICKTWR